MYYLSREYKSILGTVARHIERATKLGAGAVTAIFRSAASEIIIAEAGLMTVQERLYEIIRKHWIKIHTKPQNHHV